MIFARHIVRISSVVVLVFVLSGAAFAGPMPESAPILQSVQKADLIVLCRITALHADVVPRDKALDSTQPITDLSVMLKITATQPPSNYKLAIIHVLKGDFNKKEMDVHLPLLSNDFYYDVSSVKTAAGSYCLVLLAKNASGGFSPVDETLPLIPLDEKAATADYSGKTPRRAVIDVMLASLAVDEFRRANSYLLTTIKDSSIRDAVKEYIFDMDSHVRASVLLCMAVNQDIDAIPMVVYLEEDKNPSQSPDALAKYHTRWATPALNLVIAYGPDYCRVNTASALRKLADNSSIPYLMIALVHDDWQHVVSCDAEITLHRIFGKSAGPVLDSIQFAKNRNVETEALTKWLAAHPFHDVSISVEDGAGKPGTNAMVSLIDPVNSSISIASVGKTGSALLTHVFSSQTIVRVNSPRDASARECLFCGPLTGDEKSHRVVLAKPVQLSGTVLGDVQEGLKVALVSKQWGVLTIDAPVNPDGAFSVSTVAGHYQMYMQLDGKFVYVKEIDLTGGRSVNCGQVPHINEDQFSRGSDVDYFAPAAESDD